jgi:hypothetical protein
MNLTCYVGMITWPTQFLFDSSEKFLMPLLKIMNLTCYVGMIICTEEEISIANTNCTGLG